MQRWALLNILWCSKRQHLAAYGVHSCGCTVVDIYAKHGSRVISTAHVNVGRQSIRHTSQSGIRRRPGGPTHTHVPWWRVLSDLKREWAQIDHRKPLGEPTTPTTMTSLKQGVNVPKYRPSYCVLFQWDPIHVLNTNDHVTCQVSTEQVRVQLMFG